MHDVDHDDHDHGHAGNYDDCDVYRLFADMKMLFLLLTSTSTSTRIEGKQEQVEKGVAVVGVFGVFGAEYAFQYPGVF